MYFELSDVFCHWQVYWLTKMVYDTCGKDAKMALQGRAPVMQVILLGNARMTTENLQIILLVMQNE